MWSARDRHHPDRAIAIKLIPLEDARASASFRSEARTLAKLMHPHILRLYDAWDEPPRGVIVMELLRGSTLTTRVADGPLSLLDALRYLIPVCEALDYA